jgi:HSP20 family molecular chaperone IbpA
MAEHTKAIQQTPAQNVEVSRASETERASWAYRPNVDIIEQSDDFVVMADVPGAKADMIDVTFEDDVLTIQAPVDPRFHRETAFHRQEYGVAGFHRRFVVEARVDPDRMTARYEQGVLTVTLPKAEEAKGRRITVKSA